MKNLRKNTLVKIVSLGLFVLLAGCGSDESAQNPIVTTDNIGIQPGVYTDVTIMSLGDSITTGFNTTSLYSDSQNENWSTGDARTDLRSHYQRLRDMFAPMGKLVNRISKATTNERVLTNSVNGLLSQAIHGNAELNPAHYNYVTILMGGNDICGSNYPLAQFQQFFQNEMQRSVEALTNADLILLSSLPNIGAVVEGPGCPIGGWAFEQAMRALCPNSNLERQEIDALVSSANTAMQTVADMFPNKVLFDGLRVFNYPINGDDISPFDCFHPNLAGQRNLSETLWPVVAPIFNQMTTPVTN